MVFPCFLFGSFKPLRVCIELVRFSPLSMNFLNETLGFEVPQVFKDNLLVDT